MMIARLDQVCGVPAFARVVSWRGKSGRAYPLTLHGVDNFMLESGMLYIIANGSLVLWVGTDADVINDQRSRARFRRALQGADRAFSLEAPDDEVQRLTLVWDLEGAHPEPDLSAA